MVPSFPYGTPSFAELQQPVGEGGRPEARRRRGVLRADSPLLFPRSRRTDRDKCFEIVRIQSRPLILPPALLPLANRHFIWNSMKVAPSFFPVPSSVLLALPFERARSATPPLLSLRPDPKWKETLSQLALFALKSAWSAP